MATYTDNYQLTKPTYAEQADIGVLNSNMNKIDEVMHSSQISLAPAYDSTKSYAEGDKVMYELLMYKCISPTTGAWDGSKWERTTASESGGGGTAELDILGEASGAVASFSDGASAGLAKCIAEIVPKQDLHGYDKPWAGGAGKNLFPMTVNEIKTNNKNKSISWNGNVGTTYGVTITLHTDDGISVSKISISGTPTDTVYFHVGAFNLKSGVSYVLNGCPSNKPENDVLYVSSQPSGFGDWIDRGNGATYKATQDWNGISFYIRIWANTVQNNDWYPMIRLATETDPAFEPYSNICPITPRDEVKITVSATQGGSGENTQIALGQTVYGGQLNVLTGELTIDRAYTTVGSLTWSRSTTFANPFFFTNLNDSKLSGEITSSHYETIAPCYASVFGANASNNQIAHTSESSAPTQIFIRDDAYTNANDFVTNRGDVQIVYELATPQTVQLTPQEVNSLLGQNNISADTGDVDIVYVKASAPIQPNPTGTPTATLKKLGIEGMVFELEGGGGSSSGINYSTEEQDTGMRWIDGKPIYQKTVRFENTIPKNSWIQYSFGLVDADSIINVEFNRIRSSNGVNWSVNYNNSGTYFSAYWSVAGLTLYWNYENASSVDVITTIQYTKITD